MRLLLKSIILAIAVAGSAFLVLPYLILSYLPNLIEFDLGPFRYFGILPATIGFAMISWVVYDFIRVGEGTPAPFDPPKFLVRNGLYNFVRNPMYLGAISVFFGETILLQSFGLLIVVLVTFLLFHIFVVLYEEPQLKKRFGEAYEQYSKEVPRWFPRPRRR